MNTIEKVIEKLIEIKNLESKVWENQRDIFMEIFNRTKDGTLTWERTTITKEKEVFKTTNLGRYAWVYTVKREGYTDKGNSLVLWEDKKEEDYKTIVSSMPLLGGELYKLGNFITDRLVMEGREKLEMMLEACNCEYLKDCFKSFYNKSLDTNGYNAYFLDVPEVIERRKVVRPSGLWYWSCRIECILRDNSDSIIPKAKPGEIAFAIYKFLELKGINVKNWETIGSDKLYIDLYASYEENEEQ